MSIPISELISVNIAIAPNGAAIDGFGPLLFLSKEFKPVFGEVPVRSYSSLKEVQEDFPSGEIYSAASAWYSQKPTPKTFLVGAITNSSPTPATTASLTSVTAAILSDVKDIDQGSFSVKVNGEQVVVTDLSFESVSDFDAIATLLTTQINAKSSKDNNVLVSQDAGVFSLATVSTGSTSTLTYAVGTVANVLNLSQDKNATLVAGTDQKSVSADLAAIVEASVDFFYVCMERSARGEESQVEAARWCEASNKVFGWEDSDENILKLGTENSFKKAKSYNLRNTICVYDASESENEYPAISILARAATVNFNVANSVLVLAYKKGPGVSTANLSSGQLKALLSYNGNAFISVGGNVMFYVGNMSDGTWFDTVQGVEWLTQRIRANVFNLFYQSTTKIPWTDTGVAMVNQQVTNALELARTNGLIAPGYDNEGNFYPDGYKVISTNLELLQSQKGQRIWEGTSFIAIGSGALQGATITGNFVQ